MSDLKLWLSAKMLFSSPNVTSTSIHATTRTHTLRSNLPTTRPLFPPPPRCVCIFFIPLFLSSTHDPHCRGPPPKGQAYAPSLIDPDHHFASEVLHHRVLPADGGKRRSPEMNTDNQRARVRNGAEPSVASLSQKRGWRVQGSLAGEWRDHLGRRRRANPSMNASAGGESSCASAAALPCVRSEVSFEGLIKEWRGRLPQASPFLAELAAAYTTGNISIDSRICRTAGEASSAVNATVTPDATHMGGETGRGNSEGASGQQYRAHSRASTPSVEGGESDEGRGRCSALPGQGTTRPTNRTESEALPQGCLPLRRPIGAARMPPTNKAPKSGFRSNLATRQQLDPEQPRLLQPQTLSFYDGSIARTGRLGPGFGVAATMEEDISPSAAMVAAARAQERALPLLQVCAMKVMEPRTRV